MAALKLSDDELQMLRVAITPLVIKARTESWEFFMEWKDLSPLESV
jgi:hypothetical protein